MQREGKKKNEPKKGKVPCVCDVVCVFILSKQDIHPLITSLQTDNFSPKPLFIPLTLICLVQTAPLVTPKQTSSNKSISLKEQKHLERRRKQRDSMRRLRAKREAEKDSKEAPKPTPSTSTKSSVSKASVSKSSSKPAKKKKKADPSSSKVATAEPKVSSKPTPSTLTKSKPAPVASTKSSTSTSGDAIASLLSAMETNPELNTNFSSGTVSFVTEIACKYDVEGMDDVFDEDDDDHITRAAKYHIKNPHMKRPDLLRDYCKVEDPTDRLVGKLKRKTKKLAPNFQMDNKSAKVNKANAKSIQATKKKNRSEGASSRKRSAEIITGIGK